ncbi:MAG: hypothetical protein ACLRPW_04585 [Intestinibacter sp.]
MANAWSKYMEDKKVFAHEIDGKNVMKYLALEQEVVKILHIYQ